MDEQRGLPSEPSAAPDILQQLGLTPAKAGLLTGGTRDALLRFLLHWEHSHAALDCLKELLPRNPGLVSLLDYQARALLGLREHASALQVMRARHELRVSISSRILEGRIYLASGDLVNALDIANQVLRDAGESVTALGFLAEVQLAGGNHEDARTTYRRMNDLSQDLRGYWLGMLALHQATGDLVAASAYAVRLESSATAEAPLPVAILRRLCDYYRASQETHRVADLESQLTTRREHELGALLSVLGPRLSRLPISVPSFVEQGLAAVRVAPEFRPPAPVVLSEEERTRLAQAARELFGHPQLLPGQAETISATLQGRDVLTVLRTGGGKSLCYQLPAMLARDGTTLVISPLIALMKDQLDSLPAGLRDRAATINSSLEGDELRHILQQVGAGRFRLLYAAPERLRQVPLLFALRRAGTNRIVVDEAHCVSMWGHDFRPDYLYIGQARRALGNPPVLAMTATAPPRVRQDILQRLNMADPAVVSGEVLRPNLHLGATRVRRQDDKLARLLALCQRESGSGIVYVNSRDRAEELAALLDGQGIVAGYYHAGIGDRAQRADAQDTFMHGEVRVMVATVAFGMGIDKAAIRFIIHYDLPSSLESYYQEAGRAGRDGQPALCQLLYAPQDRGTLTRRANRDRLSIEQLRAVYGAAREGLQGAKIGHVAMGDLARDAQIEETQVGVALSLLEEAGLLRRHHDVPRNALVEWRATGASGAGPNDAPPFRAFVQAGHLRLGQRLELDVTRCAQAAGLDPVSIEEMVLSWASDGRLRYRPAGHDLLLELVPAPAQSHSLVQELLDRYLSLHLQRIDEMMAYASTERCRHSHISAYLSGTSNGSCSSCDNCRPVLLGDVESVGLPPEEQQLRIIMGCLRDKPGGWGHASLVRLLRNDRRAPERAREAAQLGQLAYRSETAIGEMVDRLLAAGLLRTRKLESGGVTLQLTPTGRRAIDDDDLLGRSLGALSVPASTPGTVRIPEPVAPIDQGLFERLRAWRLDVAHAQGVPAYVVAHDSLLQRIAAAQPRDEAQLAQISGIGRSKLARYGAAILAIVSGTAGPRSAATAPAPDPRTA